MREGYDCKHGLLLKWIGEDRFYFKFGRKVGKFWNPDPTLVRLNTLHTMAREKLENVPEAGLARADRKKKGRKSMRIADVL